MLLALILASAPLTEASKAYGDLEYEACVTQLAGLKGIPPAERARAELLLGLCHFALGHERQAATAIENALRRDAGVKAPGNASPKELAFIDAQRAAASEPASPKKKKTVTAAVPKKDEPEPEPVAPPVDAPVVEEPAAKPEPTPVVETKPVEPPREEPAVVAALPGKAPEVVKATWLPWVTGGVAVAAAGVGAGLGINASSLEARGKAEPIQIESARLAGDAQTNATGANIAFAVAGTAAVTTVIAFILTR